MKEQKMTAILEKDFITLETKLIKGYTKCPLWLKKKYNQAVNGICQGCHKHQSIIGKLTPHRIKQGNEGGLYTIVPLSHKDNNVQMLCRECHKKRHYNNYSWCKSK